jgi:ribosomal protein S18 acetylase RimI-like enzyme
MTTNPHLDKSLWFLAMDGDQIVGISLCEAKSTDYPDQGYVDQLGVIAPYRRQGIARGLLRHSFREFQQRGMAGVNLRVDDHSLTGANYLYTSEGMIRDSGYDTYIVEIRPGRELSKQ